MSKTTTKVLITGSNGLLGQKLVNYFQQNNIAYLATANSENKLSFLSEDDFRILDVTNPVQVVEVIEAYNPTHIINAAAMTNVDACEDFKEDCFDINTNAIRNILEVIIDTNIHLIQISTDFIFDGEKKLYSEDDTANPLSNYGKSKWQAEELLFESGHKNYTVLRTSLIFGVGEALKKGNIFSWAMGELRAGKELNIVNDQFRTPTFVDDLVQACAKVVELNEVGVYNVAGKKLLPMNEYIILVAKYLNVDVSKVNSISSEKLNQKARRPLSSGLDISKAETVLSYKATDFIESLSLIDNKN